MNPVLTPLDHRAQADVCERRERAPEDDPEVRAQIDALQDLIRQKFGGVNGNGFSVEVAIRRHDKPLPPLPRGAMGGSPGDWYEHEDQMTRPPRQNSTRVWE